MDSHSHVLADCQQHYVDQVSNCIAKWASKLQVQKTCQLFDLMDLLSIIRFLHEFKMFCDNNGLNEQAAIWLVPFFMKKPAAAALTDPLSLKSKLSHGSAKEYLLTWYVQVVFHLLQTYLKYK